MREIKPLELFFFFGAGDLFQNVTALINISNNNSEINIQYSLWRREYVGVNIFMNTIRMRMPYVQTLNNYAIVKGFTCF